MNIQNNNVEVISLSFLQFLAIQHTVLRIYFKAMALQSTFDVFSTKKTWNILNVFENHLVAFVDADAIIVRPLNIEDDFLSIFKANHAFVSY